VRLAIDSWDVGGDDPTYLGIWKYREDSDGDWVIQDHSTPFCQQLSDLTLLEPLDE